MLSLLLCAKAKTLSWGHKPVKQLHNKVAKSRCRTPTHFRLKMLLEFFGPLGNFFWHIKHRWLYRNIPNFNTPLTRSNVSAENLSNQKRQIGFDRCTNAPGVTSPNKLELNKVFGRQASICWKNRCTDRMVHAEISPSLASASLGMSASTSATCLWSLPLLEYIAACISAKPANHGSSSCPFCKSCAPMIVLFRVINLTGYPFGDSSADNCTAPTIPKSKQDSIGSVSFL